MTGTTLSQKDFKMDDTPSRAIYFPPVSHEIFILNVEKAGGTSLQIIDESKEFLVEQDVSLQQSTKVTSSHSLERFTKMSESFLSVIT